MAEQQIVDNIKKFGPSFQSKTIAGLLSDKSFLEQIVDIVDKEYYESPADQWIVAEIILYYHKYKNLPSLDAFKVRADLIDDAVLKSSIVEHLKAAFVKLKSDDLTFVKEQFLEFCKNQKLKSAIIDSVDLLKIGSYDQIKHLVDNALKAGAERNLGHDYIKDFDFRMSDMSRDVLPTGWDLVDDLMDGGLAPGELGVILGNAGVGKSWLLVKIASEALKLGKNVVYYSLELQESYVGRRFDACFSGVDFQDVSKHKEKIKSVVDKVPGNLKIKYYPLKTISANSIKIHVERLAMLEWKADLIVVDYADILKPLNSEKNSNSYKDVGSIYEELKMIAGELQIPCWTASQANRCLCLHTTTVDVQNKGKILIKYLKENDKVLTHLGYKNVSKIYPIEKQPIYEIKMKSGKIIRSSSKHEFPTLYGKLKSIDNGLLVGDKLYIKK